MLKFNLEKALKEGVINLFQLEGKDKFALVLVFNDKEFIVPWIKDESGSLAYISDEYTIAEYNMLQQVVQAIIDKTIYKGLFPYSPIRAKAPEFSKVVTSFIKPVGGVKADRAEEVLVVAGYDVTNLHRDLSPTGSRDYSAILATDPLAKQLFDVDAEMIKEIEAKFEDLSPEVRIAAEAIRAGRSSGIIFEGPTGTGKSFACRVISNWLGAPLMSLQITYGTTVEDLIGMFIPNDDLKAADKVAVEADIKAACSAASGAPSVEEFYAIVEKHLAASGSKGKFKFVPGPLLVSFTKGYNQVIEEVNFGQPGIIAIVNQFTDFTKSIIVNGNIYNRHDNFVCYMTMNPGYKGTETLNVALKNRFAKVNVPALTCDEFCKRAIAYSKSLGHQLSVEFFTALFNFAAQVEKEGNSSRWHEDVKFSIRNAQRLCDCILLKKCSFEDFRAAIAVQYLNDLTCDNDNSEKLEAYKNDSGVITEIQKIYDLYDFADVTVVKVTTDLSAVYAEETASTSSSSSGKTTEDEKKKILDKLSF